MSVSVRPLHYFDKSSYRILTVKPQVKTLLSRSRHRMEDNIKINLKGIRCKYVDCVNLVYDRVQWRIFVNTMLNVRFPLEERISVPSE
jgi:hypothetical protein